MGKPKRVRDPQWDNARWIAATLVVLNHLTNTLGSNPTLDWLHYAGWAMRVPLFCIVAGWFSTAGPLTARDLRKLVEAVLLPYLVLGLLHTAVIFLLKGRWQWHWVVPAWGTWFLLSLLVWRAALPYLARLRRPLLLSVVAALAVGYVDKIDHEFSAARTVTFLPFFLLGWTLRQGAGARLLARRATYPLACAVIIADLVLTWLLRDRLDRGWLRMDDQYGSELDPLWAWTTRLGVLVAGAAVALALLRVTPKRRLPVITYLGAGGLYIYLLHPLLLRFLIPVLGLQQLTDRWWLPAATTGLAVLIAVLLGSPPVRALTRPIVQPRVPWLFRPDTEPPDTKPAGEPDAVLSDSARADRRFRSGGGRVARLLAVVLGDRAAPATGGSSAPRGPT